MIFKIIGLALLGALLSFIVKTFGWRGAPLVAIAALISLMSIFASHFEKIFEIFDTVAEIGGMEEAARTLLKIIGIGYVSGISSDVCRELGEPTISSAVMLFGRLEVLVLISPMLLEILKLGLEMVK